MKKYFAVVALAAGVLLSSSAFAHGAKPKHGGIVQSAMHANPAVRVLKLIGFQNCSGIQKWRWLHDLQHHCFEFPDKYSGLPECKFAAAILLWQFVPCLWARCWPQGFLSKEIDYESSYKSIRIV